MNGIAAARWIFNADAIMQVTFRAEIAEFFRHTAVLQAFLDRVETADVHGSFALLEQCAIFGVNVDDTRGAKTELCRERAGDQRHTIGKTRFEFLPETGNAFRQEHIIDAVLQVRVLAPDVKLAERVLRHARKSQNRLVEWSVSPCACE